MTRAPAATRTRDLPYRRRQVESYLVVRDLVVPAGEGRLGGGLDDRPLVVVAGEAADRVQVGEPGDRGEGDFAVLVAAQQLSAEEAGDRPQVLADFGFVVALVVGGPFSGRPATPDPRDHEAHSSRNAPLRQAARHARAPSAAPGR